MLSGTEADIINTVARLREATKDQIRKEVGFSTDYIGFLCQYLVRKGYLAFSNARYSLPSKSKTDIGTLFSSSELKKTAGGIKIKIDFEFPVEDKSLALESNIGKIGVKVEKEKSDIDRSVQLFREIQKEGRRDD